MKRYLNSDNIHRRHGQKPRKNKPAMELNLYSKVLMCSRIVNIGIISRAHVITNDDCINEILLHFMVFCKSKSESKNDRLKSMQSAE